MRIFFTTLTAGIREPFKQGRYWLLFLSVVLVTLALFTLIPVFTVVGNTIGIQLSIFTPIDGLTIGALSLLYGLFITMQVFVIRRKKDMKGIGTALGGGAGTLFAGIAGTAFCASCLAPLFAIFGIGFGGVIFVLQYRFYFVIGIIALMIIAIYLTARKIQRVCDTC